MHGRKFGHTWKHQVKQVSHWKANTVWSHFYEMSRDIEFTEKTVYEGGCQELCGREKVDLLCNGFGDSHVVVQHCERVYWHWLCTLKLLKQCIFHRVCFPTTPFSWNSLTQTSVHYGLRFALDKLAWRAALKFDAPLLMERKCFSQDCRAPTGLSKQIKTGCSWHFQISTQILGPILSIFIIRKECLSLNFLMKITDLSQLFATKSWFHLRNGERREKSFRNNTLIPI